MDKTFIQAALYSHNDKKIYTAEEAVQKALMCQKEGAAVVHIHVYKVGGIKEFSRMANILKEKNGPGIAVSASDFDLIFEENEEEIPNIELAAIDGADCVVFGNQIQRSFDELVVGMERYLKKGVIPEVSIFNKRGAEACAKLNKLFPDRFFVGVYLDYPDEMEVTQDNILELLKIMKSIKYKMFAILDNKDDEIIRELLKAGVQLRCGEEDTYNMVSNGTVEEVRKMAELVKDCGLQVERDVKLFRQLFVTSL